MAVSAHFANDRIGPFSRVQSTLLGGQSQRCEFALPLSLGPDDGTLALWAVVASLPFAPEIAHFEVTSHIKYGRGETVHHREGERESAMQQRPMEAAFLEMPDVIAEFSEWLHF